MDSNSIDFMALNRSNSYMMFTCFVEIIFNFSIDACLIVILCRYRPLLKGTHLFHGNPDAIPDAYRLDFTGVDHPVDGPLRNGKVLGNFVHPVIALQRGKD